MRFGEEGAKVFAGGGGHHGCVRRVAADVPNGLAVMAEREEEPLFQELDHTADLGIEVHVVTSSQPGGIEAQSERVFRERRIGAAAPTGGILVLINPAIRQARIEVGYSLEGGLTDLHMGRLARDQLAPYVSYASAGMAAMDVLQYLRNQAYLAALVGNITLGEEFRRRPAFAPYRRFYSGGAGAKTRLSDLQIDADLKRPVPPAQRVRYAPSADVEESVAALLRAMADLAGDPTLPLFTEGSRMMRTQYPLAPFEELERLERIDASLPLEYRVEGDYAVATSRNPASGFVPILLHREEGLWRVDSVETWKNLFFDADGNYFLRNSNTPYRFGLGQFGEGRWYDIAQYPLGDQTIAQALAELDARRGLLPTLWRAETWFRNAFVFSAALPHYEKAMHDAPQDPLVHEIFARRALYLGFPELAIPAFQVAGPGFELELAEAWRDQGDGRQANYWVDRALAEDPYNLHALNWKAHLAERHGTTAEQKRAAAQVAELVAHPGRIANPVWLAFEPRQPRLNSQTTIESSWRRTPGRSSARRARERRRSARSNRTRPGRLPPLPSPRFLPSLPRSTTPSASLPADRTPQKKNPSGRLAGGDACPRHPCDARRPPVFHARVVLHHCDPRAPLRPVWRGKRRRAAVATVSRIPQPRSRVRSVDARRRRVHYGSRLPRFRERRRQPDAGDGAVGPLRGVPLPVPDL